MIENTDKESHMDDKHLEKQPKSSVTENRDSSHLDMDQTGASLKEDEEMADYDDEKNTLTELQDKYDKLNDKFLRQYSEFENYRRRTAREKLEVMQKAGAVVVKELLPVMDDFDRAVISNEKIDDSEALKEGFSIIHKKLFRLLEKQGLKPMESQGQDFDTEYHEAITNIPAPSPDLKGKVVDVAEKGYYFQDAILRHAKVVVGQ